MKELKFAPNPFARPQTPADILALLREIRSEADNLQAAFDRIGKECAADVAEQAA